MGLGQSWGQRSKGKAVWLGAGVELVARGQGQGCGARIELGAMGLEQGSGLGWGVPAVPTPHSPQPC